ncbi:STAS domain-containing protein [Nannocystis pusilla]|uniref:STAS domain-containing protein n=1 Tax=Nannocystis pusilla TaxID=889268 RepID=UPI003B7AE848
MLPLRTSRGTAILLGVHARGRLLAAAGGAGQELPAHGGAGAGEPGGPRARTPRQRGRGRAAALEQSNAELQQRVDEIERQRAQILRLSAPVLRIWRDVLAVPLAGTLEEQQIVHVSEKLLETIVETRARVAILDMTGLETIEVTAAERLHAIFQAAHLLGVQCFVSGVRPRWPMRW